MTLLSNDEVIDKLIDPSSSAYKCMPTGPTGYLAWALGGETWNVTIDGVYHQRIIYEGKWYNIKEMNEVLTMEKLFEIFTVISDHGFLVDLYTARKTEGSELIETHLAIWDGEMYVSHQKGINVKAVLYLGLKPVCKYLYQRWSNVPKEQTLLYARSNTISDL